MTVIDEKLLRKRAEHNEGVLRDLKEVTLHQFEIRKIENIDRYCPQMQILYLQNNLIDKIENLHRLKDLRYLNMALNNVTVIEGLEGCEMLQKLDLTCNFVEDLTDIEVLEHNYNLRDLYLLGNPCASYKGYRDYVIATLPNLRSLDAQDIERGERIRAIQRYDELRESVIAQHAERQQAKADGTLPYESTPQDRIDTYEEIERIKKEKEHNLEGTEPEELPSVYKPDGTVRQCNKGGYHFVLTEEEEEGGYFVLDLYLSKYLDTSLIDADCQPTYVRVNVKGKIFQLVWPHEIRADDAIAQRSEITGHLVIKAPFAESLPTTDSKNPTMHPIFPLKSKAPKEKKASSRLSGGPVDVSSIASDARAAVEAARPAAPARPAEVMPSADFVDNPDVPPLE